MFSKSKINEPGPKETAAPSASAASTAAPSTASSPASSTFPHLAKPKPPASLLSSDLVITGNLKTSGDIQIEGTVKGDIRAHSMTVGESARIDGEILADDVVVNGHIKGRVRGLKVRLTQAHGWKVTSSTRPSPLNRARILRARFSVKKTRLQQAQILPRHPLRQNPQRRRPRNLKRNKRPSPC